MKILIISAPFDPARRASAICQAERSGLEFEIVEGVNGDTLDLEEVERAGAGLQFPPRTVACYLSHIRALRRALELGNERTVIVEDDWRCLRPMGEAVASVPPCDYLVLHGLDYPPAPLRVVESGEGWERLDPPPIVAVGYVVSRRFAELAVAEASPVRDHVDHYFRSLVMRHGLASYRAVPPAVTGAGFPSTLGHS